LDLIVRTNSSDTLTTRKKKEVYKEYDPEFDSVPIQGQNKPVDKNIPMTADLCAFDEWTGEAIRERGKRLGEIANEIWTISAE